MKYFILVCLLHSSLVLAEKKEAEKDFSLLGKIDEESLNKVEASKKPVKPVANSDASKFSISCKDATGKELKKGEVGYDSCLTGVRLQKKNSNDNNSASLNFKIGD